MTSVEDVWAATVVGRSSAAATAFLVWDVLITLDDEVSLVWPKPHSFRMKWLFFFVRYFAIIIQLSLIFIGTGVLGDVHYSHRACVAWYIWQEVSTQVLIAAVEVVLISRVQALYLHTPWVTYIVRALWVAENVGMIVALTRAVSEVEFDSSCVVTHSSFALIWFAAAFGAFETLLFLLTFVKFVRALFAGWGNTPVITLLVRDGTWAFALIFAVLAINAGFIIGAPGSLAGVAFEWLLSIESLAGARLVLNMLALEPAAAGATTAPSVTSIRFSSHVEYLESAGDDSADTHIHAHTYDGRKDGRRRDTDAATFSRKWRVRRRGEDKDTEAFEMGAGGASGSGSGSAGTRASTSHNEWTDMESPRLDGPPMGAEAGSGSEATRACAHDGV